MQNCSLQQDLHLELSGVLHELHQEHACAAELASGPGADGCTRPGNHILGQGGDVISGDFPFKNLQQKAA